MNRQSSSARCGAAKFASMLAAALVMGGCVVGVSRIRTPERLAAEDLPHLTRRVSFDACVWVKEGPSDLPADVERSRSLQRERLAKRVSEALLRGGVHADLVAAPGMPARFTVIERDPRSEHLWTTILSGVTLSVIPGYSTERYTLDVVLAAPDSSQAEEGHEHLRYEAVNSISTWLPLIVSPDIVVSPLGAWISAGASDPESLAFEGMIQRLADDLRDRLGHYGDGAPWPEAGGAVCPLRPWRPSAQRRRRRRVSRARSDVSARPPLGGANARRVAQLLGGFAFE